MRLRLFAGTLILGSIVIGGAALSGSAAAPAVKWAAINLTQTTRIAGAFVSGPVVFVHDDEKMAKGEPCTGVYRFLPGGGLGEEIVSFHCTPKWGTAPEQFTATTTRDDVGPPVLREYQFAGDAESHGVPVKSH